MFDIFDVHRVSVYRSSSPVGTLDVIIDPYHHPRLARELDGVRKRWRERLMCENRYCQCHYHWGDDCMKVLEQMAQEEEAMAGWPHE